VGTRLVSVAVTPNGYADAVHEGLFVTPAERLMTISQFLDIIGNKTPVNGVVYIQKQNSNFTEEFSELSDDVDLQMTWATRAFGNLAVIVSYLFAEEISRKTVHILGNSRIF